MMPLIRYIGLLLEQGRSPDEVAGELLEDTSLPGRAYPPKIRTQVAEQLKAQARIRKTLGCEYKPSLVFKLDRIPPKDGDQWDVVVSQIVQASTEKEARQLASQKAGDEGKKVWMNPRKSTCTRIPDGHGPRVLLDKYVS